METRNCQCADPSSSDNSTNTHKLQQGISGCSECTSFRDHLLSSYPSLVTSSDSGAYQNLPASDVSPDTQDPSTGSFGYPNPSMDMNFSQDQHLSHSLSALHLLPDWPEAPPLATLPALPPTHFLSLARSPPRGSSSQRSTNGASQPTFDTSTVAAADFDVDAKTGFMPPHQPVVTLPGQLDLWEKVLSAAVAPGERVTLGEEATEAELAKSAKWRRVVDKVSAICLRTRPTSSVTLWLTHDDLRSRCLLCQLHPSANPRCSFVEPITF